MKFVNRTKELALLRREYHQPGARFVVVYGRRRLGKTRLIKESLQDQNDAIFYLAADEKDALQIREFQVLLGEFFQDEFLASNTFTDWKSLFSYLAKVWPRQRRVILVIDEVTYIIKNNPSFPSYLQQFWELCLNQTETCLVLSGSLVGLMLQEVLGGNSPLYGRRTAEIFLEELPIQHVQEFLGQPLEEAIPFFALVGGVPKYLEIVDRNFSAFVTSLFDAQSFFYREGLYLMTEEFNDISTYSNLLRAVAEGKTRVAEIADYCGLEGRKISSYLAILENVGFIEGLVPVVKEETAFRGKLYQMRDSFLEFWFRFIHHNRALIELGRTAELAAEKKNEINSFIGRKFEKVCFQFLVKAAFFSFTKVGKQWGKMASAATDKNQYEIDLCALNEKTNEILFGECKWQENVEALQELRELRHKAAFVPWRNQNRKEYYAIFAKSFKDKNIKGVDLFDLKDIENILKTKQ